MRGGLTFLVRQALGLARVFFLFAIAMFLPKLFLVRLHSSSANNFTRQSLFRLGVENLSTGFLRSICPGKGLDYSVGLVTNQTGKDQSGMRTVDILLKKGLKVSRLFCPEHGMDGTVLAAEDVDDSKDLKTGIPIVSLYRKCTTSSFSKDVLQDIDVLFFDMQDSGMRHYTYITTMFKMLEAAAQQNKIAVVLDRPNLLGSNMEGPLVTPELKSAISYASIPIRYGMTVGELAVYYNQTVMEKPAKLYIAKMRNYNRSRYAADGLLAHLSPNIASVNSCYGYSFLGLLGEIQPFDLGIGTSRAFQCILLSENLKFPKKKWHELHMILKQYGVENSYYRYYSSRKQEYCSGLRLRIANISAVNSFSAFLQIVQFFQDAGLPLTFSKYFDKAAGTPAVRQFLLGGLKKDKLVHEVNRGLHNFFSKVQSTRCFLYRPLPKVVNLS